MPSPTDILKASILVVDDMPANVLLLQEMLRGAGYTSVTSTGDSREVCGLHLSNRYDLIVLDLQMPYIDGFQVMAGLNEVEPDGGLSVLVITAQPGHKLRALKAGAKGFVSKPFNLAEVLVQVQNLIEVRLLRRSADRLSAARLMNSQRIAGIGDWDYDLVSGRRIWSDEIYQILGIPREACPPDRANYERMVHPEDLALFRRERASGLDGSGRSSFDHRIVRQDGRVRCVHYSTEVLLGSGGMPAHEVGTVQDITDRKLAEDSLRTSEERYRTMLTLSPDAHIVIVERVITFVNRAFCHLTGAVEPGRWIGRPVRDLVDPAYHRLVDDLSERPMGEHRAHSEIKFVRLDGSTVDVEISHVLFDFQGRRELQLIARDITKRKELELHFRQAHKMEALGRVSGGIAHDFNNIIMAISANAELVTMNLRGDAASATVQMHLGAVMQASQRAGELVRQILTFSHQQPQVRLPMLLQPVIAECARLLQGTVPPSVAFDVSVSANSPTVLADAGEVHRVIMNLATNAWQAMKGGPGRLHVGLEEHVVDEAHAAAQPRLQAGVYARVSVADTGCGMSEETLQHIFEPFFTTKPAGEGTGLGLAVVHGIMEAHDGAVTVDSRPGEGTVFNLYFPALAGGSPGAEDPAASGDGERVPAEDDEPALAGHWEKTPESLGCQAQFTTSPAVVPAMIGSGPGCSSRVLTDQVMAAKAGMALDR
jgi:PAS domain S-box-containing protein